MNEEEKNNIIESIKSGEEILDKYFDFKENTNIQLLLYQLSFFQIIASIIIGLVGVSYFFNPELEKVFLALSLCFALVTCVLCTSFTREIIDKTDSDIKDAEKDLEREYNKNKERACSAIQNGNAGIFFKSQQSEINEIKNSQTQIKPKYIGEIIVFTFYLSVGFLLFSLISKKYFFGLFSYQVVILLIFAYLLSFKNWAVKFSEILSKRIL